MFTLLGWSLIGGAIVWSASPIFESIFMKDKVSEKKLKEELQKAFVRGEFYKTVNKYDVYPTILNVDQNKERIIFVFSIPKGMNPDDFEKRLYVFKQHFGPYIKLDVDIKKAILSVYPKGIDTKFRFCYSAISATLKGLKLPIVCGKGLDNKIFSFDMVKNPHVLIAGETGSGKSSAIRSILTTIIKTKTPEQVRLILGDLKRSEFHLFKQIEHAEGVYHTSDELRPILKKIKRDMAKRGALLDEHEVMNIEELKEKIPYIVVCIDEVVLLKKEKDIMDILEEISSIGRSLGVFLILSMQRPDAKLLDGKLKVNLTVRMGFKSADSMNAKIIGTPGAEKIKNPGRMLLKVNSDISEIQAPLLENEDAKKLLMPYKQKEEQPNNVVPLHKEEDLSNVLGVLKNDET